ncbi:MAG: multiheme c-type cytochrome [Bacteroidota bacterium]|nr:multiheme c-type cytochrome [Bacteroidota bacterium]
MSFKLKKEISIVVLAAVAIIVAMVFVFRDKVEYQTITKTKPVHYNGEQFAGSQSCIPCHQNIYKTHINTPHFNTSAIASEETLKGPFNDSSHEVELIDGVARMIHEGDAYYQTISSKTSDELIDKSRLDIVVGSGVKGQSYLTFNEDFLTQLQVSYFTLTDDFINSPGYPNYRFTRSVTDNCIKCHVTFAKNGDFKGNTNIYERESFIYGIDCERCHGPLQKHVDFRTGNLQQMKEDVVIKIDTLARQLKMDICVQCHSGLRAIQIKDNPFSFVTGEKLDDYAKNYNFGRPETQLDVHGNQYGLLKSSECFKNSSTMSCTTCHDPHQNQRGETDYFNAKCVECHALPKDLHKSPNLNSSNLNNCISCHMPLFPSQTMKVQLGKDTQETSVNIRTHLIGIYVDGMLQKRKN